MDSTTDVSTQTISLFFLSPSLKKISMNISSSTDSASTQIFSIFSAEEKLADEDVSSAVEKDLSLT